MLYINTVTISTIPACSCNFTSSCCNNCYAFTTRPVNAIINCIFSSSITRNKSSCHRLNIISLCKGSHCNLPRLWLLCYILFYNISCHFPAISICDISNHRSFSWRSLIKNCISPSWIIIIVNITHFRLVVLIIRELLGCKHCYLRIRYCYHKLIAWYNNHILWSYVIKLKQIIQSHLIIFGNLFKSIAFLYYIRYLGFILSC